MTKIVYKSALPFPFAKAVRAGDFVFVSGQLPFGPDGAMVQGAIEVQTRVVLETIAATLEEAVIESDLVIGGVLIPGASAPKLVTRDMVSRMPEGSVIVDVAIDQGGCTETSKPTTHDAPTYVVDGVVHYCVANMPGAVARTSTLALNNVTLPFIVALANKGPERAMKDDPHLRNGLNVFQGKVTFREVAESTGYEFADPDHLL